MDSGYRIGQRIAALRKAKNLSQQQLADELGEVRETVKHWENGARHLKDDTIIKLARYFGVTTDYLLCVSESTTPADTDVTILTDRFGFSHKAARELTVLSIPANGKWAKRKFEALNRLLSECDVFEGILDSLYNCLHFGSVPTHYQKELVNEGRYPKHTDGFVTEEEIYIEEDRAMWRSAAIYNPQCLLGKLAEKLIAESEKAAKQKTASGASGAESGDNAKEA